MLVVGLAALDDRVAVVLELSGFFFNFRLATKQHALRADDARAALVGERGEDVQDEGVIAVASGRCLERRAPPEAGIGVLETLLAEDFFLELVLFLLVVRLLLG